MLVLSVLLISLHCHSVDGYSIASNVYSSHLLAMDCRLVLSVLLISLIQLAEIAGFYLLAKVEEAVDKPICSWIHHIMSQQSSRSKLQDSSY
ncbi:hypothetical protein AtEden1_Chr3g0189571 [Arabidopsis thaliana]